MSDLISRQAAIKAIKDLQDCPNGFSDTYDKACIIGVIEDVPSAEVKDHEEVEDQKASSATKFDLDSFENKIQKRAKAGSFWSNAGEYERGYEKGLSAAFKEVLWLIEEEKDVGQ